MWQSCQSSPHIFPQRWVWGFASPEGHGCFLPFFVITQDCELLRVAPGSPSFVPTVAPSHLGGFLDSFGDPPSGTQKIIHCSHHAQGSSPSPLSSQATPPFLFFFSHPMMPLGAGNLESHYCWRLPFGMKGTQVLCAPGPTLNSYGFYSSTLSLRLSLANGKSKGNRRSNSLEMCVPRSAQGLVLHPYRFTKFRVISAMRFYESKSQGFWNSVALSLLAPPSPRQQMV